MDPLSVTASAITVTGVTVKICQVLANIRSDFSGLPGRLHALNNEIEDFRVVLQHVLTKAETKERRNRSADLDTSLISLPDQGLTSLLAQKDILDGFVSGRARKRESLLRNISWRGQQGCVTMLQEDVKRVKSSLNVLLGVSNSQDMMRIKLGLEQLTVSREGPQPSIPSDLLESLFHQQNVVLSQFMAQRYTHVDDRLNRVEALLEVQSTRMHAAQISRIGPLYDTSPPPARIRPTHPMSYQSQERIRTKAEAVGFQLRQYRSIILLQLNYETNVGPSLQLSTLRRVADTAQCVTFALNGNIEGLKALFSQGLASPRDISSTRGYSLLRRALYGQQYEACKFLMEAGADPGYRPIAPSDDCPSDKSVDIILRGGLQPEVVEILKIMSESSDFIERQNFNDLHMVVPKLIPGDLEDILNNDPAVHASIDAVDATGRTALQWASARGDERAVVTLLSYGADPNNMDKKLNTPLTLAANQNQTVCVRLLLEAGAFPDPILPKGIKFGTPLNCAARNARDSMLMKTLLDFDADKKASSVDGVTPLLHVARGNSATLAMLLLEYGADINATSTSGQTPLTAAIQYNNHAVLRLLLARWFEYNECPRLKGPNLFEIVARRMEAGFLNPFNASAAPGQDSDSDSLIFEDGKESLQPSKQVKQTECPLRDLKKRSTV
ncbi:hypothetical protein DL762_003027 [Monosporascus cannonballus]|uniref:Fungal N-terminal domain-containing protein n=1 Tax=Monosporascus cannonballus TaxID=155416 RepID=A0ABY0HCC1_9PEZI|nr:hypothetical protein DL762_003027 [Monosporascus cannonballus]RYO95816.1 hypothetical protein DL763_003523 [Monosporascus cannonballus]